MDAKQFLKEKDIDEIVKLYNLGKTQREITDIFECSKTTTNKLFKELFEIKKIKKRKNGI